MKTVSMLLFALSHRLIVLTLACTAAAHAQKREDVEIQLAEGRRASAVLYLPDRQEPAPAVMVLHTINGTVESFDERYAQALAKEGFVALAPNYIHPSHGGRVWSPAVTRDMAAIADYLKAKPESKDMPIGAVGFSLGSRGLLLAAQRPEVKAVVVYYGTFDARKEKGVNLPPAALVPMQVAGQVNAAVLLLHGDADDEIPVSSARAMAAALREAGKAVELVEYKGAYHRFDRGPTAGMSGSVSRAGYTYRRDDAAAADAYARTVRWLKEHLR
jgi:dienelactone hydrolase